MFMYPLLTSPADQTAYLSTTYPPPCHLPAKGRMDKNLVFQLVFLWFFEIIDAETLKINQKVPKPYVYHYFFQKKSAKPKKVVVNVRFWHPPLGSKTFPAPFEVPKPSRGKLRQHLS